MTRVVDRHRNQGDRAKVSSEYLYLAQELGLDTSDFSMLVPLSPKDRVFAADWIHKEGLEGGYAVAIPFTTRPQKHWFEDRWAPPSGSGEEGDEPSHRGSWEAPGDSEAAGSDQANGPIPTSSPWWGRTSLTEAAAVIEGAALVLGVDTGLTHMGIAFDRPHRPPSSDPTSPTQSPRRIGAKVLVPLAGVLSLQGQPHLQRRTTPA